MVKLDRTKENPWVLKTPPGTSEYTLHVDQKDGMQVLVCTGGNTVLLYDACCIADLDDMLKKQAVGSSSAAPTSKSPPGKGRLKPGEGHHLIPSKVGTMMLCERMMRMAENKTKPTESSVTDFLNNIEDQQRREDCFDIIDMMRKVSHSEPVLWGSTIIGFGTVHYVYESGREGDTVAIGFSPRKQNISLYLTGGLSKIEDELLQLGKFKTGKSCLYIKSLSDVNVEVLEKIFAKSFMEAQHKRT